MTENNKIPEDISLIVYDFDGVMTNNKVTIDQSGNESVTVNRSDGLAISEIKKLGITQIILSTEKNPVTRKRAEKLDIFCLSGIDDKKKALAEYLSDQKIDKSKVIYIGNDINDLEAMLYVGIPIAPKDAHPKIREIASFITEARGGDGVIREFLDILNKQK